MPVTYQDIDARIMPMYRELEQFGIPIDSEDLQKVYFEKQKEYTHLLEEISKVSGFYPNPNRATDWQIVADKFGVTLPLTTRGPKTDDWTIKRFRAKVPILDKLSSARKLSRVLSYLKSIQQTAFARMKAEGRHVVLPIYKHDEELGRVHSGGEANPMSWAPEFTKLVKMPGHYMVEADFSALELRVLAVLSRDPRLLKELSEGDVHIEAAKAIFKTENPTAEQRQVSKVVTYATMFGGGPGTVYGPINDQRRVSAEKTGKTYYKKMSYDEAFALQEAWRDKYPVAAEYIEHLASTPDYAVSYYGRRKALPQPTSNDPAELERLMASKRHLAVNSPIQNTGGDLAKQGFANVYEDPRIHQLGLRIITTRFDSILLAVPKGVDKEDVERILKEDMESADSNFPLEVKISFGPSWGDVKE